MPDSRLVAAIRELKRDLEPRDPVFVARVIGDAESGDPSECRVEVLRPDNSSGERRDVVKGKLRVWPGMLVRLSANRKLHGPGQLTIIGADRVSYGGGTVPSTLELHGNDHGYQQIDETTNLHWFQIYPLRVQPESGLTVRIQPGVFYTGTGYNALSTYTTLNLTSSQPASGERWVNVSLQSSGAPRATNGVVKMGGLTTSDIPLAPTGDRALAAIRIASYTTELTRDHIEPLAHLETIAPGLTLSTIHNIVGALAAEMDLRLTKHVTTGG